MVGWAAHGSCSHANSQSSIGIASPPPSHLSPPSPPPPSHLFPHSPLSSSPPSHISPPSTPPSPASNSPKRFALFLCQNPINIFKNFQLFTHRKITKLINDIPLIDLIINAVLEVWCTHKVKCFRILQLQCAHMIEMVENAIENVKTSSREFPTECRKGRCHPAS